MFCPKCGTPIPEGDRCPNCGYQIPVSADPATAPQPVAEAKQPAPYPQQPYQPYPGAMPFGAPPAQKKSSFDFKSLLKKGAWFAPAAVGAAFLIILIIELISTAINRNAYSGGAYVASVIITHFGLALSIGACFALYFLAMNGVKKETRFKALFTALLPFVLARIAQFIAGFIQTFFQSGLHVSYGIGVALKYVFWILLTAAAAAGAFFLAGLVLKQFSDEELKRQPKAPKAVTPQTPVRNPQQPPQQPPVWQQQTPPQPGPWNGGQQS